MNNKVTNTRKFMEVLCSKCNERELLFRLEHTSVKILKKSGRVPFLVILCEL